MWPDSFSGGLICSIDGTMRMVHPGMPFAWAMLVVIFMGLVIAWSLISPRPQPRTPLALSLAVVPGSGPLVRALLASHWPRTLLRIVVAALFLLAIAAGFLGTPIPERNLATVLTWNVWWSLVIVSVFFVGSAWCSVCPWETLGSFAVNLRLWGRAVPDPGLGLKVPRLLRSLWPAAVLFAGLTWLELGFGITRDPRATAVLAVVMVALVIAALALFERKAFCRYMCPVGRTIGAYSQLAPVALRPVDPDLCLNCETLDCYHGSSTVEPCPTFLTMGRLQQNTYCLSCTNCAQSCPKENVSWQLRPMGNEARQSARPHLDEAGFTVVLLALTTLHGVSMVPFWDNWITELAMAIGDGQMRLGAFTVGMATSLVVPAALFIFAVAATRWLMGSAVSYRRLFALLAFAALPVAFTYHLAHNVGHVIGETQGFGEVLANPFGSASLPLSATDKHLRMLLMLDWYPMIFTLQAGLMALGFWLAIQVLRHRGASLDDSGKAPGGLGLSPMLGFVGTTSGFNLWLLTQDMLMRL